MWSSAELGGRGAGTVHEQEDWRSQTELEALVDIPVSIELMSVIPAGVDEGGVCEILWGAAMSVAVGRLDSVMNKHLVL